MNREALDRVNFEYDGSGRKYLKMVYAFLIHSLAPGPCRVLYSAPFVHETPVRTFIGLILCSFRPGICGQPIMSLHDIKGNSEFCFPRI